MKCAPEVCGVTEPQRQGNVFVREFVVRNAPATRQIQWTGSIKPFPMLGGLDHHYARV
jgi:hypothetical protein